MPIILGIDPGIATTGFGLIKVEGQKMTAVKYGCISTPAKTDKSKRLLEIAADLKKIIKQYRPRCVVCEQLFFAANSKTAITVGEARGVVLVTVAENKIPLYEFTPLQIKQAVTGYGRADKQQIQQMVKTLLKLKTIPKPDDASDALAAAICLAHSHKFN